MSKHWTHNLCTSLARWGWLGNLGGRLLPPLLLFPSLQGPRDPGTHAPSFAPPSTAPTPGCPLLLPPPRLPGPAPFTPPTAAASFPKGNGIRWGAGSEETQALSLYCILSFRRQSGPGPGAGRLVAGQCEKQKILCNQGPLYVAATGPLINHGLEGRGWHEGAAKYSGGCLKAGVQGTVAPTPQELGELWVEAQSAPRVKASLCEQGNMCPGHPFPGGRGTHPHIDRMRASVLPGSLPVT